MIIKKAELADCAVNASQYPTTSNPEFVLVGRSNVGKSSLINKFLNRKGLARTSSKPGKTQTINFYNINDEWLFVDLPGYGYAKRSKELRSQWAKFINEYLNTREEIAGIIHILDIRHPPSKDDITMHDWIMESGLPYLTIATKGDKVSRGQWLKQKKIIIKGLGEKDASPFIIFSAQTGEGKEEFAKWIEKSIAYYKSYK